jgi:uncharacterized protein
MENSSIIKASIIGACIIVTAFILGNAFKHRNATLDSISVVGLGSKDFESDEILFSGSYNAKAEDPKAAYASINSQAEIVKQFFRNKGFAEKDFSFSGVSFDKTFRTQTIENNGSYQKTEQVFDGYLATQHVSISANKNPALMSKIEAISQQTSELINNGVVFSPDPIQYTYSDLPSLKKSLIELATSDANERAKKIVKTADGDLGKLKMASMGVFQIKGKGAEDTDDTYGGVNDVHSKSKTARITVRLEYGLD